MQKERKIGKKKKNVTADKLHREQEKLVESGGVVVSAFSCCSEGHWFSFEVW